MIEGLPWQGWIGIVGASVTLNAAFVWFIFRGSLIPRTTYDDKVHDANEWRTEGRIKDEQIAIKDSQIAEKDAQLRHLGEVGRTVEQLFRSLQDRQERGPT